MGQDSQKPKRQMPFTRREPLTIISDKADGAGEAASLTLEDLLWLKKFIQKQRKAES